MLAVSMPNFATSLALVESATKCFATAASSGADCRSQSLAVCALVRVSCVVKVLEATMNSVVSGRDDFQGLGDMRAVHIGDEVHVEARLAVGLQRFRHHDRAEVGAADADVDDIGDRFAGIALPFAAAHPLGELAHVRQHRIDLRHDVLAVHQDGPIGRGCAGRYAARRGFR